MTADALYGQDWHFCRMIEEAGLGYVVAVPKSQQVKSLAGCWRNDQLIGDAPEEAWERFSCGGGAKGPRIYGWAAAQLLAVPFFDDEPSHRRWVMARRSIARPDEIAYYLAHAPAGTTVGQLVTVAGSRWSIESCFQSAKNECGLDEYEVRRYVGWSRHTTLAMLTPSLPPRQEGKGRPQKRITSCPAQPGRSPQTHGSLPPGHRTSAPSPQRSGTEMVPLAPTGHSHALPLQPAHRQSRTSAT
ncbi:hypothetical protein ACFRKC_49270 [Streptomyces chartreusis]|uniref:IS701 family transposase n=1 Tax=Streptomyces chartreusis TaxID=1969 RepID=UPI0036CE586B